jgi:hypothetical protein
MRKTLLIIELVVFGYLAWLLYFLAAEYDPAAPGVHPPFAIFVIDTINLFIHEAGHFFFKPFGMVVHVLAGSIFQILLPLLLVIVTYRTNIRTIGYAGFWLGESIINVSIYIKDAPYRQLKLIGKGLIHDWHWLLSDNLDLAEPLAFAFYFAGVLACLASIGVGVWFAVKAFRTEDVAPE